MKKLLAATLTIVTILVIATQASAQVATFNSLSLHFSNTVLTAAQYRQVLESSKANRANDVYSNPATKQHLEALPATGYLFGDNKENKQPDVLATPDTEAEPMTDALDRWVAKEIALQQPKRHTRY